MDDALSVLARLEDGLRELLRECSPQMKPLGLMMLENILIERFTLEGFDSIGAIERAGAESMALVRS